MELFKYVESSKYSQDLCAGIVSFGSLSLYSDVENTERLGDARVDEEEGVINTFDGVVKSHKIFANHTRVFCCSTMQAQHLEGEFGKHVVRITDAHRFAFLLSNALQNQPFKMGSLIHQLVNYTDEPIALADYQFIHSQCFTKPKRFSNQYEYRYAFVEKDELSIGTIDKKNPARRAIQLPQSEIEGLFEYIK